MQSDDIGIVHYRRYFPSRRQSCFVPKKERVVGHEELDTILEITHVVLPKERHYFVETNYTQYIHAHHKKDLEATCVIIQRKYPEFAAWECLDRSLAATQRKVICPRLSATVRAACSTKHSYSW